MAIRNQQLLEFEFVMQGSRRILAVRDTRLSSAEIIGHIRWTEHGRVFVPTAVGLERLDERVLAGIVEQMGR